MMTSQMSVETLISTEGVYPQELSVHLFLSHMSWAGGILACWPQLGGEFPPNTQGAHILLQ